VLVTLEIALYQHEQRLKLQTSKAQARVSPKGPMVTPGAKTPATDLVGRSPKLEAVLQNVRIVAPTDTSVLILGETGTGKELIAKMIHEHSPRKDGPLVKVNCAAMPATLIESTLFGHEQGAFTGAAHRKRGKFEQAHQGTIFLDEIGEISLDMQVKLLRVLQEKEIEPLGSEEVVKVNCRVIAATNKDLEAEVSAGRFRMDLYYRLNVFPIALPPLRERMEDLPALAEYFVEEYSKRLGKPAPKLAPAAIAGLQHYHWPGNIRELEHAIERSVLLTQGDTIWNIAVTGTGASEARAKATISSLDEIERGHIIEVLKKCNGKIAGKDGAAELLQMHPSTLNSRIKKLGIQKLKNIL